MNLCFFFTLTFFFPDFHGLVYDNYIHSLRLFFKFLNCCWFLVKLMEGMLGGKLETLRWELDIYCQMSCECTAWKA